MEQGGGGKVREGGRTEYGRKNRRLLLWGQQGEYRGRGRSKEEATGVSGC